MEDSSAQAIGRQLYEERIRRRLSVEEAAQALRIRRDFLVALEEGNWSSLPGEVYAQGFCRNYARWLGLDGEQMLDLRRHELEAKGEMWPSHQVPTALGSASGQPLPPRARTHRRRAKVRRQMSRLSRERSLINEAAFSTRSLVWLVVVLVGLLLGGIWLARHHLSPTAASLHDGRSSAPVTASSSRGITQRGRRRHSHPAPTARATHPSTGSKGKALPKKKTLPTATAPVLQSSSLSKQYYKAAYKTAAGQPVSVRLTFTAPCWISGWVDGRFLGQAGHTYAAGQHATLKGRQSVKVWIGNIFAVSIRVDGRALAGVAKAAHGKTSILSFRPQ